MDLPRAQLPRMARVRQVLPDAFLPDVSAAVREALAAGGLKERVQPGQRIAITAGSRGISNIALVIPTCVEELRAAGGEPVIVPAMGSHGGATPEGQRAVLAQYGITEAEVGAAVLATRAPVTVGHLDDGPPSCMDRSAH